MAVKIETVDVRPVSPFSGYIHFDTADVLADREDAVEQAVCIGLRCPLLDSD